MLRNGFLKSKTIFIFQNMKDDFICIENEQATSNDFKGWPLAFNCCLWTLCLRDELDC